jgi:ABC-type sulfate/molybdate transport systems ATPase subunit
VCHGLSRAQAQKVAYAQLAAVGCAHLAARRGGELSGGQAAIMGDDQSRHIGAIQLRLQQVAHSYLSVNVKCGSGLVLEHGRIIEDGVVSQLLENPKKAFTAQLAALVKFGVRTNSQGAESSS